MSDPDPPRHTRTIKVDYLARVEGEGALHLGIREGRVEDVKLKIFEPPRFFEAFLRGRHFREAPDLTARICGICPVAYQMSACHAVERAAGVTLPRPLRELRRLLYCGEWIESHCLHLFMLHAPDFLGYESAIAMAKDHREVVQMGLKLKKTGNDIGTFLGGREIHPINVKVGGFYKAPRKADFTPLAEDLLRAADAAEKTVDWVAALPFPEFAGDYEYVGLSHPDEYPMNEGRILSNRGLDIEVAEYEDHFEEEHVPYTNALHSIHRGHGAYFVGPMARYALNHDHLSPRTLAAASRAGLGKVCHNPFQSIIVRALEILYACEEALRVITEYEEPDSPDIPVTITEACTGWGCTEAPRGLLYHRYDIGPDGLISQAKIVPPTSQNQKQIEDDLRKIVPLALHLTDAELQWRCEQAIRNYDPCISCATHFLKIKKEEVPS
ncbi:MAG: nickel-dependent hydrogenase large subunit [Verrucomicrobia bacterium]|nr:nickel-dependent hydrogenase large subunit [Verrucomicrobiota bacterium]